MSSICSRPIEIIQAHTDGCYKLQWSRSHEHLLATYGRPGANVKVFNMRSGQVMIRILDIFSEWGLFQVYPNDWEDESASSFFNDMLQSVLSKSSIEIWCNVKSGYQHNDGSEYGMIYRLMSKTCTYLYL